MELPDAAGSCDAPPPSHSTLLYVLSVDNPEHNAFRCYHRKMHQYLGVRDGRMMLAVDNGHRYRLRLFYVLDLQQNRSLALREELAGAGRRDILELRDSASCLQKIIACLRHAARSLSPLREPGAAVDAHPRHRFDSIIFGDDDAVFHPHRFMLDMAEAADPYLLIGQLSWAGYWDRVRQRHRGYVNTPAEVAQVLMAPPKHASDNSTIGPFVFPVGMWMGMGASLAQHLATAVDAEPDLVRLQTDLKSRAIGRKCDPEPDSGLGYILYLATRQAALAPLRQPLKLVDVSSTQRLHFWRNPNTLKHLQGPLSVLHGAKVWDDHHRFFACSLSQLPAAGTAVETSRPNECGLALPHFSQACHNPELPRTPQRGGGFHRNAPVEPMSPEARAALGASCVDYFQRAWPKDTVWCKMLTQLSRRRCTYLTVNGAPCNTSAEQVGCPATARPAKRL